MLLLQKITGADPRHEYARFAMDSVEGESRSERAFLHGGDPVPHRRQTH